MILHYLDAKSMCKWYKCHQGCVVRLTLEIESQKISLWQSYILSKTCFPLSGCKKYTNISERFLLRYNYACVQIKASRNLMLKHALQHEVGFYSHQIPLHIHQFCLHNCCTRNLISPKSQNKLHFDMFLSKIKNVILHYLSDIICANGLQGFAVIFTYEHGIQQIS